MKPIEQMDREKIEAAAKESYPGEEVFPRIHQSGFKDGVRWRDKNPSPAVLALVEALKEVELFVEPLKNWPHLKTKVSRALAAYEESLK